MSLLSFSLLRSSTAHFRVFGAKNFSMVSRSSLLRSSPVLTLTSYGKGSTSDEVRHLAQSEMQDYWERNIKLKRPVSPHATIYKPPLCMCTSFMHRSTGVVMCLAWMALGCGGFWYTGNFDAMLEYINSYHFAPYYLFGAKFLLAYPLIYHYTNGIRHLAWDYSIGFDMKTVNFTATTNLIFSFLLTLALASIKL